MTMPATAVDASDTPLPAKDWRGGGGRGRGGWGHTGGGVLILAGMLFPVYWMLNVSLQPSGSAVGTPWLPLHTSFGGYAKALQDQSGHLATSLLIATGSVVLSLLVAAPAAYALSLFHIPGANLVLLVILISQMVPGIVVANALYSAYSDVGLLNSIGGVRLAPTTAGIPVPLLIPRAFMSAMPAQVVEA